MIFLTAAETEAVFDWPSAIACIRDAYAAPLAPKGAPGRVVAADRSAWLRCMPAIPSSGRYNGVKQISRTREGRLAYVITLFDKETGELAYLIDGVSITALRTSATSAAALEALDPDGALDLCIIGSGLEAQTHFQALAATRKIRSLAIYSPTEANRQALANQAQRDFGIAARATASVEEAVRGATHVIAAARSRDETPLLFGDWLNPDAVVISVGSTTPSQREIDVSVVERASLIVSDVPEELAADTGDMIAAKAAKLVFEDKMFSLHDLIQGRIASARGERRGIVMFKSVGSALQDVVFAEYVALRASSKALGRSLDLDIKIKQSIGRNS